MFNSVCLSGNPALLLYRLASYPSNRNTLISIIIIITITITIIIIIIIIIIINGQQNQASCLATLYCKTSWKVN